MHRLSRERETRGRISALISALPLPFERDRRCTSRDATCSGPCLVRDRGAGDRMTLDATILSGSSRRQAAVALITATAMQAFDATIANVAFPQLEQNLGGGVDLGSWVMTSSL